jgi:tripartite-type tricarboxylate transporter receptor subunit TctC
MIFDSSPGERVEQKQVKGYAAVGAGRIKRLPNMPAMKEVLPNWTGGDIGYGIVAPANTPIEVVQKLSDTIKSMSTARDYNEAVEARGFAVSYTSYSDFAKRIREEYDNYGEIIRKNNIKPAQQ